VVGAARLDRENGAFGVAVARGGVIDLAGAVRARSVTAPSRADPGGVRHHGAGRVAALGALPPEKT